MTSSEGPLDPPVVVRAAFEVLVFAPLGFGAMLIEDAPAALGKARREISNARFLGRFAVNQGVAQVRSRLEPMPPTAPADTNGDTGVDVSPLDTVESFDEHTLTAGDLALPDYDTLPAIDIVAKLQNLTPGDRNAIERYESTHRQRRTVLGKLAQLAGQ